jgi:rhodanese-related sulfurtransferase/CBS domain-containing protein
MAKQVSTVEVEKLREQGALLIEVLPKSAFEREHIAGAVNVPFSTLDSGAVADLDRTRPTIAYCYDHECDLSARAAHRLEALGFTDVYDYAASKVAWLAFDLPHEGTVPESSRAGSIAHDAPTCTIDATVGDINSDLSDHPRVVVLDDDGVVLGVVRAESASMPGDTDVADVMHGAPPSVRPSVTADELAKSMDDDARTFVLVTTPNGTLFGVIERDDLYDAR